MLVDLFWVMVGGGWWHSLVHLEFTVTFSLFDLFD